MSLAPGVFFLSDVDAGGKRRMMVASFEPGSPPRIGAAQSLFQFADSELTFWNYNIRPYDVAPDGKRFYVVQDRPAPPVPPVTHINLVENWFEELKAKVQARR